MMYSWRSNGVVGILGVLYKNKTPAYISSLG